MKTSITQTTCIFLVLLAISGCQTIEPHGQIVDDNILPKLENKALSKSEVENLIGTPTIIPDYTSNTWYYIERVLARRAWFTPKVIEQRIVKIEFNNNNRVREVTVLNDSHQDDINIISEYTKTYGTELSGVQKFVKNIGRFNKTTDGKKQRK